MEVEYDPRSGLPIYEQIVDQVERQISKGELSPGDQLPTVRELAEQLEVNFNTVARAYRMLDEAGVISTQQGRGTYVLEPGESAGPSLEELARRLVRQAERMGHSPEEVAEAVGYVLGQWDQEGKPPA